MALFFFKTRLTAIWRGKKVGWIRLPDASGGFAGNTGEGFAGRLELPAAWAGFLNGLARHHRKFDRFPEHSVQSLMRSGEFPRASTQHLRTSTQFLGASGQLLDASGEYLAAAGEHLARSAGFSTRLARLRLTWSGLSSPRFSHRACRNALGPTRATPDLCYEQHR